MKRTCSTPGCVNPPIAEGACEQHRSRTFAETLAEALTARDASLAMTARVTGIDRKSIWNYLNGRQPRADIASRLAQSLDWPALGKVTYHRPISAAMGAIANDRLLEHELAVSAFCRACEPVTGICRDSRCELRGVSPLPFIALHRRVA